MKKRTIIKQGLMIFISVGSASIGQLVFHLSGSSMAIFIAIVVIIFGVGYGIGAIDYDK